MQTRTSPPGCRPPAIARALAAFAQVVLLAPLALSADPPPVRVVEETEPIGDTAAEVEQP